MSDEPLEMSVCAWCKSLAKTRATLEKELKEGPLQELHTIWPHLTKSPISSPGAPFRIHSGRKLFLMPHFLFSMMRTKLPHVFPAAKVPKKPAETELQALRGVIQKVAF